ncbi:hypothetical protein I4F81_011412 [Pyropia yezoensis]|uniref:Uncharacterized protein n=1 Tax=Pyropia yezoensis TaxID=2788 RepID=A0ACC3CFQ5_PYRYE|nr:hypothetical protein I4F81_011412 [Neopyropia yezoensis]
MPHLSGTTCPPKLVGLSLRALAGCVVALATRGVMLPGAVCAAPFSMYYITGAFFYALLVPYVRGTGVVLRSPGVVPLLAAVAAHRDGWLHTGDLARVDPATGAAWVLDRLADTIAVEAFNVSPVEVEAALRGR